MLNNIRSDLYRLRKGKSLYISIVIVCTLFILMQMSSTIVSNSDFATYDAQSQTLSDFLYYFPKSMFFMTALLTVVALFRGEEITSGFIKNIYVSYESPFILLLSRWVMSLLVWIVFWASILIVIVLMNVLILHDPSLYEINVMDYGFYCMIQMLILSAVIAFIDLIIYRFRNKTIAIVIALAYAASFFFMVHSLIIMYLPSALDYSSYTLVQVSGTLPTTFEFETYMKAFLLAFSSLILYTIGSYYLLKKKDLL